MNDLHDHAQALAITVTFLTLVSDQAAKKIKEGKE